MTKQEVTAKDSGEFELGNGECVFRLGFGAMRLTGDGIWGPPKDRIEAERVLRRCLELGINLIDTADAYGPHVNEELIAEVLYPYPPGLVIATKGGLLRPSAWEWERDARPSHLKRACEGSLKRLRVEQIALYQLHAPDPKVPFLESVEALAELQREGKIRHLGLSNVSVRELERARSVARIATVQNRYNFSDRASEDVLDYCTREKIGFLPWYPLGTGSLVKAGGPIGEVARRLGVNPAQIALAWLLRRSPVMLPIPGTASLTHLEENLSAIAVELGASDLQ